MNCATALVGTDVDPRIDCAARLLLKFATGMACVLHAAVDVEDKFWLRVSSFERHLKRKWWGATMAASRTGWLQAGLRVVWLAAMTLSAGCMMFLYDPVPYVSMARRNANDAPALTEWTLRQTDIYLVARGVMALKLIAECDVDAPSQQRALAVLGLVKIADKRRGSWPDGDTADYWTTEVVLEAARDGLSLCESTRVAFEQQLEKAAPGAEQAEWQHANDAIQRGFPPLEH